jgi:hypothetical protein
MSTQRTLTWWEPPRNIAVLTETRFNLNLAFQVESSNNSDTRPNVVFRSQTAQPRVQIRWQPKYALGFTQDLPPLDSIVYRSTAWQPCGRGETYGLSTSGFFTRITTTSLSAEGDEEALSVSNRYPVALHFIVGMYSADTQEYEPIFVDPRRVAPGQSASYRPTGVALWWLDRPLVSGSFFEGSRNLGAVRSWDFEASLPETGRGEVWTSFDMAEAKWNVDERAPSG